MPPFPGTASRVKGRAPFANVLRAAVTIATLFAFLFQTLVVQTHIHNESAAPAPALTKTAGASGGKAPANDDANGCQICQALLHAGTYLPPVPALPHVAAVETITSLVLAEASIIARSLAHGWNSRAPPRR
jgi:hypothetical protein